MVDSAWGHGRAGGKPTMVTSAVLSQHAAVTLVVAD